jgi:hypothetical protein
MTLLPVAYTSLVMLILLRTVLSFTTLLPSPRSYSPIESTSFLCLPRLSSSNDASTPSAPISITPPLPPATPLPPPPHSFSKPPITHVFSRHPKNPNQFPSSCTTLASLDEPVVDDSNNTTDESSIVSDELWVGPRYNLRDRTTVCPADKYGFPHVNAIVESHLLIRKFLVFQHGS